MYHTLSFKRLIGLTTLLGILFTMTLTSHAQEDAGDNTPLPEADAGMQEMDWFIGEWTVESRLLVDRENDTWTEETLRTVHTYELGGHIILENFIGPLGGEPYEAWSIRQYNPQLERWQQRWFDTSSTGVAQWTGTYDAETNQYIGYSEVSLNDEFELAGDGGLREVFFNIEEDSFSWRLEGTRDAGETWNIIWTLEYTRAE